MELDPKDFDVVELLAKLKNAGEAYPSNLFASRRQGYIRHVAEIGMIGDAAGSNSAVKSGNSGSFTPTAGGLLEIMLIVVIVAEAGATAFFYRDKISEIVQSYSSKAQVLEVTSPPETASPPPAMIFTELPEIAGTPTAIETLTGTPVPDGVADKNDDSNNQTSSTPDPNGDNGNNLGQTPKPDRTKDPGDNNNDRYAKDQSEGDDGGMDN